MAIKYAVLVGLLICVILNVKGHCTTLPNCNEKSENIKIKLYNLAE